MIKGFCFSLIALAFWAPTQASQVSALDIDAPVPAVRYESVFGGFQRFQETGPGDWRRANETVGRIGGWKVYSRETGPNGTQAKPAASHSHPADKESVIKKP